MNVLQEYNLPNWRIITLSSVIALFTLFFVYSIFTGNADLLNIHKIRETEDIFEKELKEIEIPPKTAVNDYKRTGRVFVGSSAKIRYRTELNQEEFVNHINNSLLKNGWKNYGVRQITAGNEILYYQGKFKAILFQENSSIFNNDGFFFTLTLKLN